MEAEKRKAAAAAMRQATKRTEAQAGQNTSAIEVTTEAGTLLVKEKACRNFLIS